jgi:hypothetical protein
VVRSGHGHLVESPAAEWVAAHESSQGECGAAQRAVQGDRGDSVIGACGLKSAAACAERVHRRGEPALVERESGEQKAGHNAGLDAGAAGLVRCAARAASEFA